MNKLDQLIRDYCPDGVEFLTLSELFDTRNGYTPSRSNKEYWENGTIPWFRMEDIRANGGILSDSLQYVSESAVKGAPFPANSLIVATSATIGEHALITVESISNQRFTYLMIKEKYKDKFDMKFLYYYCFKLDSYCLACLNQGNFASVDMSKFYKFEFPMVPLPVQTEIVRILDSFTENTKELVEKLSAELMARKQQYASYCRYIIDSANNTTETRIRDLGKWSGGMTPSMSNKSFWKNGTIPWVSSKDMKTTILMDTQDHITQTALQETSIKLMPKDTVAIVARSGILKHTLPVVYIPIEVTVNQDIKILVTAPNVLPMYAYYSLLGYQSDILAKTKKQGGTVDSLEIDKFMDFKIPVPPIAEQKRIVDILTRFDSLCNDLSTGIPAEIEARKQQYEFYRDKLLTFKELKVQ